MSHNKMERTLISVGLASALLFTSACSLDNSILGSSASPSAEPALENVFVDGVEYGPTIEGMPTLPELASDSNGEWRKTTILPNDPAFTYDPAVVDPETFELWSEEEVKEAHRIAVEMAVDTIDTSANGAPNDVDGKMKWWEDNKDKFHPYWKQDMYNGLISDDPNTPIVFKGAFRQQNADESLNYTLAYGENEVHVKDRKIDTKRIVGVLFPVVDGTEPGIMIQLGIDHNHVAVIDGEKMDEKSEGTLEYSFMKDRNSGELLISGINAKYNLNGGR